MITIRCPVCHTDIQAPDELIGTKTHCPKCQQKLLIPGPQVNKTMLAQAVDFRAASAAVTAQPPAARSSDVPMERRVPSAGAGRQRLAVLAFAALLCGGAIAALWGAALLRREQPRTQKRTAGEDIPTANSSTPSEASPPSSTAMPDDVARLIRDLQTSKDAAGKVEALRRIAEHGTKAQPTARAVCTALLDDAEDVRQAAIEALGKIQPAVLKPVLTIIMDKSPQNYATAARQLATMGASATAAIPILVRQDHIGAGVDAARIQALAAIGKGDEEATKAVMAAASKDFAPNDYDGWYGKQAAIEALGTMNATASELRRQIVACLADELDKLQGSVDDKNPAAFPAQTSLRTVNALAAFGKDAIASAETLKKLRMSPNIQVREAAMAALKQIEQP